MHLHLLRLLSHQLTIVSELSLALHGCAIRPYSIVLPILGLERPFPSQGPTLHLDCDCGQKLSCLRVVQLEEPLHSAEYQSRFKDSMVLLWCSYL